MPYMLSLFFIKTEIFLEIRCDDGYIGHVKLTNNANIDHSNCWSGFENSQLGGKA